MKLIVGLGNPGEKYERTRHNMGFVVVDQFLKNYEPVKDTVWEDNKKLKSDIATIEWKPKLGSSEKVILAKPKTFMNNSGMAVLLISQFYKIKPDDIWIVHDDIDLQLGSVRIRFGGSSGGHRGIASIMGELKTDKFWRFRLGISHPKNHSETRNRKYYLRDVDDFVLSEFTGSEKGKAKDLVKHAARAIACGLEESLESAMNKFNTK
ncbi:MAG: aminoacyl-tRNA hydrolase [Candidatus Levybacteria bacterium]|nr:aminoacyl-tRNA hydrolase [Candidatus Levybacteria bacterium]